jgi:hypothetical protein
MYRVRVEEANVCCMRKPIVVAVLLVYLICVDSIAGLGQERIGVSRLTTSYTSRPPRDSIGPDPNYLSRAIPGFAVGALGAVAGGALGYALAGKCNKPYADQCEYHGFGEAIVGGFVGGIVGSALGAALPVGRAYCTRGQRFTKALGGATLGGAVAIGLLLVHAPLGFGVAATVPVGAAIAMRRC